VKVTLISTVLNCADRVAPFLASLDAQTRRPDEVIVVDGGSSDGTADRFRTDERITVIDTPGAGIAAGRNIAITHATHEVIAVTDADCELDPGWLAAVVAPVEAGADVSAGFYAPIVNGFFEACLAAVNLPLSAAEVDPERFMPSARSVAFRRDAIEAVGGYPEWLAIGEDMWVNHRWRELGMRIAFAPEAVVRWPMRPDLRSTWIQYFRYARGDALAGLYPERHALRFATYGALAAVLAGRRTWPKLAAATAGAAYAGPPVRRAWTRLAHPTQRAAATVTVPGLLAWVDAAKMAGYAAGLSDRLRGRASPGDGAAQP
jgi:glycosyltransferase involved in cell wall biosynthesis